MGEIIRYDVQVRIRRRSPAVDDFPNWRRFVMLMELSSI